tara:strand:+ start:246 stop:470 length:225 start_codon:yes stop_codon:yes gene_type:complete
MLSSQTKQVGHLGKYSTIGSLKARKRKKRVINPSATLIAIVIPKKNDRASINTIRQQQIITDTHGLRVVLCNMA